MQLISDLCDMIDEELNDSEKYIKRAITCKENGRTSLAATFNKLSLEEMNHAMMLHEQVTSIIETYRKEHGDPPEKMLWVYDYLHGKHIDHANAIKILQGFFKS